MYNFCRNGNLKKSNSSNLLDLVRDNVSQLLKQPTASICKNQQEIHDGNVRCGSILVTNSEGESCENGF